MPRRRRSVLAGRCPPASPHAIPNASAAQFPPSAHLLLAVLQKPLASPEQATLAFAPTQWAAASAAAGRPAGVQGRRGTATGPAAARAATAQEAAAGAPSGSLQDAEVFPQPRAGGGGALAQPAAQPEGQGGEAAPAAANGSAPLEPILRALELLDMQSQRAQQKAAITAQRELSVPPLPPHLATSRGGRSGRSGRSSSTGPASIVGSPPPGAATVATGPVGNGSVVGSGGNGLVTPRAAASAIPPLSTPAVAGGVQADPSPAEPSPSALPALLVASAEAEAAAPAAAAKSRSRSRQQRQRQRQRQQEQQQQEAEAAAGPPRPSKRKQAKRRDEQQDGQQVPRKKQRQRNSKAAPAAAVVEVEQPSADAPTTPPALPCDPCLPLYDSSSAQGTFHYIFGGSLLFKLPPPAPPLGERHVVLLAPGLMRVVDLHD